MPFLGVEQPLASPEHSPHGAPPAFPHSPTLQRAAHLTNEDILRVLMTTVGDLSANISATAAQQAQTNLAVSHLAQLLSVQGVAHGRRPEFRGGAGGF